MANCSVHGVAQAQSCIGRPVEVNVGACTVLIGSGTPEVEKRPDLFGLKDENLYLDTILEGMESELLPVLAEDRDRTALCDEQQAWSAGYKSYCITERKCFKGESRRVRRQLCVRWAKTTRLEELLMRYDSLTAGSE